jgi:hypothetical protein
MTRAYPRKHVYVGGAWRLTKKIFMVDVRARDDERFER